jgi:phosphate transport system permease protein
VTSDPLAVTPDAVALREIIPLGATRPRWGERIIKVVLASAGFLSVGTTVAIVIALAIPTIEFFGEVSPVDFFTGTEWSPLFSDPKFGVLPLITATLVITGVALIVAVPVGLGSAIYLSEYAHPRVRRILKPTLEVLAGVPTVIFGFFALTFIGPMLQDWWPFGEVGTFSALAAGLVMGVMIVPTIASLSEDAMAAVPHSLREGAYAMGATKREVAMKVVVPAALSGIVAAFVLGVSRAIGETMIVAIAAGGTPNLSFRPDEAMQTMTAFIAAAGMGDQPTGSVGYKTIFAVGSTLFVITLVMNMISIRLVRKYREEYE